MRKHGLALAGALALMTLGCGGHSKSNRSVVAPAVGDGFGGGTSTPTAERGRLVPVDGPRTASEPQLGLQPADGGAALTVFNPDVLLEAGARYGQTLSVQGDVNGAGTLLRINTFELDDVEFTAFLEDAGTALRAVSDLVADEERGDVQISTSRTYRAAGELVPELRATAPGAPLRVTGVLERGALRVTSFHETAVLRVERSASFGSPGPVLSVFEDVYGSGFVHVVDAGGFRPVGLGSVDGEPVVASGAVVEGSRFPSRAEAQAMQDAIKEADLRSLPAVIGLPTGQVAIDASSTRLTLIDRDGEASVNVFFEDLPEALVALLLEANTQRIEVPTERKLEEGGDSKITSREVQVVSDDVAWQALWERHTGRAQLAPEQFFEGGRAIVGVFLGGTAASDASIELDALGIGGLISLTVSSPPTTGAVAEAGAYAFFELNVSDLDTTTTITTPPQSTFEAEVVAVEITYGAGGADVPVQVEASRDGEDYTDLSESPVQPGQVLRFAAVSGLESLVLRASTPSTAFTSQSANALTLGNGDDLAARLEAMGTQAPLGGQQEIAALLEEYLDADGRIALPGDRVLILFELGTTDPGSSAYDFQDLVLLVERR